MMRQSNRAIHNTSRKHNAIGIPTAKMMKGMQSAMPAAANRSPMTTVTRRSGPGTASGRAWLNIVARAVVVSVGFSRRLVATVTVCRPAIRSANRGTHRVVTRCRAPLAHAIVIVGQYRFLLPFRVDDDDSFQRGRAALIFGVRFCVLKSAARDAFVKQPPELVGVDGLYKVMIEPGLDRVLVIAR
jgi:hypothetical protein